MIRERQRIVGLISGGGSTIAEIVKATRDDRLYRSEVVKIITSNPDAFPEERRALLRDANIPLVTINPQDYSDRSAYGEALLSEIQPVEPDVIGQYGHTPWTPKNVILAYPNIMINQHPGPVDPSPYDFGGVGMSSADRAHAARLLFVRNTNRSFWTDVTAQRVGIKFDKGPVLKRGRVEIFPDDTVESLKKRALPTEWETQIALLRDFEEGTVEELPPYDDLVRPEERELLSLVKRDAIYLYPEAA